MLVMKLDVRGQLSLVVNVGTLASAFGAWLKWAPPKMAPFSPLAVCVVPAADGSIPVTSIMSVNEPAWMAVLSTELGFGSTAAMSGTMFSPNELSMPLVPSVWLAFGESAACPQTFVDVALVMSPSML